MVPFSKDLPDPKSPALQADSLLSEPTGQEPAKGGVGRRLRTAAR